MESVLVQGQRPSLASPALRAAEPHEAQTPWQKFGPKARRHDETCAMRRITQIERPPCLDVAELQSAVAGMLTSLFHLCIPVEV